MANLRTLSALLIRCFLVLTTFMCLGIAMIYFLHDLAYSIHAQIFTNLTPEHFDATIYQMFAQLKIWGLILFLAPWIALQHYFISYPEA